MRDEEDLTEVSPGNPINIIGTFVYVEYQKLGSLQRFQYLKHSQWLLSRKGEILNEFPSRGRLWKTHMAAPYTNKCVCGLFYYSIRYLCLIGKSYFGLELGGKVLSVESWDGDEELKIISFFIILHSSQGWKSNRVWLSDLFYLKNPIVLWNEVRSNVAYSNL